MSTDLAPGVTPAATDRDPGRTRDRAQAIGTGGAAGPGNPAGGVRAERGTAASGRTAWTPGHTPGDYVIGHARAVLPDRIVDDARIVVRDHRIVEIGEGTRGVALDVDARNMLLTPGFIDVHSDALEKERTPRSNAEVPLEFAMSSFTGRVMGAGCTTMFHGAGFQHQMARGVARSVSRALELCAAVDAERSSRVEHRILHRLDILSEAGAQALADRLAALPAGSPVPLVSHEDHTPGQGQYADPSKLKDYMIFADGLSEEEADAQLDRLVAEGREGEAVRQKHFAWLSELAAAGRIRLLGHDPDTAQAIDELAERGGSVAEFPTTLEAARRARERGMPIVAGAPNALRGRSHSGNVSAGELAALGLVDALASDYLPAALLGGVRTLVDEGIMDLPQAIGLITAGPARVAGLADRGTIAAGQLADFAFVSDARGGWPHVVATFKAGEPQPAGIVDPGTFGPGTVGPDSGLSS